jgi:hypothetical protein
MKMRKYDGYDGAEAFTGDYEKLSAGGHICRILQIKAEESDGTKNYDTLLRIGFDIYEGENKDYYKRQFDRKKAMNPDAKWPGMYYQTIKADDLRYFKGFVTAIENSNQGFKWDWDEQKLKNKLFGGVFGEEEYEIKSGKHADEIGTIVKLQWVRSVEQIRSGNFKVPDVKRITNRSASGGFNPGTDESDDELPF